MNIYKNFLSKKDFKKIKSFIMGNHFPWYYSDGVIDEDDKYDQFVYTYRSEVKLHKDKSEINVRNLDGPFKYLENNCDNFKMKLAGH